MQPVQTVKNQYQGINAHLHSQWQATHKWNRFHNYHIGQLMAALRVQLLPLGYTAYMDESLQIRRVGDDLPRRPRPDVLIRDLKTQRMEQTPSYEVQPVALMELVEDEQDFEHPYSAVGIYELLPDFEPGNVVGWLELLSPTNKGNSKDAYTYLAKRRLLLERGLVLIELDYLHETPPTFERLPDYSAREPGAHPYRIAVIDPRPDYYHAGVYLHEFDVDMPIPAVRIPLNAGESILFDFDAVYRKTFEEGTYGYEIQDYRKLPVNFDRYSEADRLRILARILTVIEAAKQGQDLTQAPLPRLSPPASLDEGLALLEKAIL